MTKWIDYQGTRVLLIDYSGLKEDALLKAFLEVEAFIINSGVKNIIELVDFTDTYTNMSAFEQLKRTSARLKPYVGRTAVLGLSGIKVTLLDILVRVTGRSTMRAFHDKELALKWLVAK
ncbi:MAG: hypothetical protein RIS47_166 [Bacteroidota bacterium]|jgi:hypothetical protein